MNDQPSLAAASVRSTDIERGDLIQRVASVTRLLRESMRELGLDQAINAAAVAIPDARDRLRYVARMTEQSAERTLTAAEQAKPLQQALASDARALDTQWESAIEAATESAALGVLVADTRAFLAHTCATAQATNAKLMDIVLAQDFQDLTGQVIMKMMDMIAAIETELLQVLVDNAPLERRREANALLNGPQVATAGKSDIVTDQGQVDDLLASLGF
jgi:chemotaxis protein CheZ